MALDEERRERGLFDPVSALNLFTNRERERERDARKKQWAGREKERVGE
jgi:hypothetical protein